MVVLVSTVAWDCCFGANRSRTAVPIPIMASHFTASINTGSTCTSRKMSVINAPMIVADATREITRLCDLPVFGVTRDVKRFICYFLNMYDRNKENSAIATAPDAPHITLTCQRFLLASALIS